MTALASLLQSCETISTFSGRVDQNSISVPLTELAEKKSLIVRSKELESDIALIQTKSGEWKALLMLCTHASNPLTFTGSGFRCNVHFSDFNLDGVPQSGPAQKPLKLLATELKSDSILIKL